MDYQSLNQKTVVELRSLAKETGVKIPAGTNKGLLIQMLIEADKGRQASAPENGAEAAKPEGRRGRGRRAASEDKAKKGFICTVCGYLYEGDTLPEDYICPLCKHDASYFVPADEYKGR